MNKKTFSDSFNMKVAAEIQASIMTGRALDIVKKYTSRVEVVETYDNGISLLRAFDEDGKIVGEWHGVADSVSGWGGKREGAGRKPTGRKRQFVYATDEEFAKIKEFLEGLRRNEL